MSAAEDEDPVGAFAADGADPAFGDGVRTWRTYRRADDFYLFRGEHLWVPESRLLYATCVYSWMAPPSRSRRMTLISVVSGLGSARSGAA